MGVKSANFKIGDLVVQHNAEFNDRYFIIGRVDSIEYVDELSDMWMENYDEEPYYLYGLEIVYLKQREKYHLELGDVMYYEENELTSLLDYFSTNLTIEDYIDYKYNNKEF